MVSQQDIQNGMGTQAYLGVFSVGQSKDEIKSFGRVVKRTSWVIFTGIRLAIV